MQGKVGYVLCYRWLVLTLEFLHSLGTVAPGGWINVGHKHVMSACEIILKLSNRCPELSSRMVIRCAGYCSPVHRVGVCGTRSAWRSCFVGWTHE